MSLYKPHDIEKAVAGRWKRESTYARVRKAFSGKKPFFFMDGPPYATASIHLGTAWNKIIKDAYIRFWRMQGFNVWDQPGFDTHGTPIEVQVEKTLGFSSKKDIESYGTGKFIRKCRQYATKYIDVMSKQFADLGVWMDWQKPYLTLDNRYIEGAGSRSSRRLTTRGSTRAAIPSMCAPAARPSWLTTRLSTRRLLTSQYMLSFR